MQEEKSNRLTFFIETVFGGKKQFADLLNISVQNLSAYVNGRIKKPSKKMMAELIKKGLNVHWLETGEGEMLVSSGGVATTDATIRDSVSGDNIQRVNISRLLRIPLYNIPAYALRGTDFDIFDEPMSYVELAVGLNVKEEDLVSFRVTGDSMVDAHIRAGDIIAVNVKKAPTHNAEVCAQKNSIIMVKRYHKPNGVAPVLRSVHDGTTTDVEISIDDSVKILGVVEFVLSYRR